MEFLQNIQNMTTSQIILTIAVTIWVATIISAPFTFLKTEKKK